MSRVLVVFSEPRSACQRPELNWGLTEACLQLAAAVWGSTAGGGCLGLYSWRLSGAVQLAAVWGSTAGGCLGLYSWRLSGAVQLYWRWLWGRGLAGAAAGWVAGSVRR